MKTLRRWLHSRAYDFFKKYLFSYNSVRLIPAAQVKMSKDDIIAYEKEHMASDIGREMLKSGMIKVVLSPDVNLDSVRVEMKVTVFKP